ncbi:MAG: type II toxin-antitoxin system RelE/ParE family toxin [Cryomorphaceae bacterium]|nr:type II toxin-antitoxin system RelE/ParE family toxin [Flavobacteriales bacterium]
MSYDVLTTPQFDREVKKLSKKYRSLKADLNDLSEQISENPMSGDPLGENLFKVRLAISSKGRGKSGGGRVVTFLRRPNAEIYLIAIYDKSEIATLSKQQIKAILKAAGLSNE